MSRSPSSLVWSLCSLLGACSEATQGPPPDADAADTNDASDTADAADTGDAQSDGDIGEVGPTVPILEREAGTDYACAETLAPVGGLGPSWIPLALANAGDQLWLLRSEGGVMLSTLGPEGALGADIALGGPEWVGAGGAIAARDDRLTVLWSEPLDAGGEELRCALVSTAGETGEIAVAPASLPGTHAQEASGPRLLATEAGHRLVWLSVDASQHRVIRHALLDGCAFTSGPTTIVDLGAGYGGALLGLVADDDGFALAWSAPNASYAFEVWFQTFAADGTARHPARRVSREGKDGLSSGAAWRSGGAAALARAGERYLVAFTEDYQRPGSDFSELGHAVLQIAVVDARGDGALVPLSSPVEGRIATAASFYRLGEGLGLFWAEGTIIRICGGCYVDYVLRTIVLDPAGLDPLSAPATHTGQDHGFNAPHVAVLGDAVVSVSLQDFHALSRPAVATMRCLPPD